MKVWLGDVMSRSFLLADGPFQGGQWWSSVMLCPKCGQVWGRVERKGDWLACHVPCSLHGNKFKVGGSFLLDLQWSGGPGHPLGTPWAAVEQFLREQPELRRHEFNVHMAWAGMRGNND